MRARPWRRAIVGLAMKLGRLPHELLAATDSVELTELLAYLNLQAEEANPPPDSAQSWQKFLGQPQHA